MATLRTPDEVGSPRESAAARAERLAAEREMIAEARDDVAAGRIIEDSDLDNWLEGFVRGDPVDLPEDAPTPLPR